ncbi:hypothetical protein PENFLA_c006G04554 [Penicillium flavigenum]|uniref:Uncharacterized protein n=1 Tax=Penicillium flavigenum TaxID=254877 RepID=A0A1V6TL90_9EURO|nr:hypothetical protein PENFLA_c006G04554 [Penicillium flavigenum]
MTFDWMDQRTTTSIEQEVAMLSKFRAIWTETKETVSKFQQLQTRTGSSIVFSQKLAHLARYM